MSSKTLNVIDVPQIVKFDNFERTRIEAMLTEQKKVGWNEVKYTL